MRHGRFCRATPTSDVHVHQRQPGAQRSLRQQASSWERAALCQRGLRVTVDHHSLDCGKMVAAASRHGVVCVFMCCKSVVTSVPSLSFLFLFPFLGKKGRWLEPGAVVMKRGNMGDRVSEVVNGSRPRRVCFYLWSSTRPRSVCFTPGDVVIKPRQRCPEIKKDEVVSLGSEYRVPPFQTKY